jgi:hypothetical protein
MTSKPVSMLLTDLGRHPHPFPAPRLQRQSLFRSAVPHPQIPTRLPGPFRITGAR